VRTQRRRESLITWLIVGPWAIVLAFPFYWMVWTALKTEQDLYNVENVPFSFSSGSPTLDNVRFLFEETDYARWLWNTVVIGVFVVAITLLVAAPAGYALARLSGRWGQSLGVAIFMVYLVPPTLLFLPLSRLIVEIGRLPFLGERGLQDTIWSLVLVYPSFTIPFSTWLLMGFFKSIPRELEEAALVDGASRLRALRRIVLPVSLPGLLTVVIFAFSLCVNEFVYAVSFITTKSEKTISTGVYTELIRGDVFYWGALMAATLIPAIPLAILYNVFLDRFIAGFTGGAFR
jgi:multiple sugar transport system permease protein